jgi:hypothetical protein
MPQHPSRTGPPPALSPHEAGGPEQAGPARARHRRRAAAALAMTLALVGPWAWAELSDPPPGEPPGPPTPPPPPDPPPPPSPPDPDPGGGPELPPWRPPFPWAMGGISAVWDGDLKVEVDPSMAQNGDCAVTLGGGSRGPAPWPFTPAQNDEVRDWSRNDPGRTITQLANLNLNLYLHESDSALSLGVSTNADWACDWHNLSALNDEIEATLAELPEGTPPIFTGLILRPWVPALDANSDVPGNQPTLDYGWYTSGDAAHACRYRDAIVRGRQEAAEHPDIHRVVIIDELFRFVRGPDHYWPEAAWPPAAVGVLGALAREASPGAQRALCDDVLDTKWNGGVAPVQLDTEPGYDPALALTTAPEEPVELWARMHAASVPRLVVPSVIIGVLGAPPVGAPVAGADHQLAPGEAVQAWWNVWTRPSDTRLDWDHVRIWVDLLVNLNTNQGDDGARLIVSINGVDQPALTLNQDVGGKASIQYARAVVRMGMGGAPPGPWGIDEFQPNRVEVRIERASDWTRDSDVTATVFGGRVTLEQIDPSAPFTVVQTYVHALEPAAANFGVFGTPGMATPGPVACGGGAADLTAAICTDNSAFLVGDQLDGVSIAHDLVFDWAIQGPGTGMPYSAAWSRFIEHTCRTLWKRPGSPTRCVVDERQWLAEVNNLGLLNYDDAVHRIKMGRERGDGEINTFLAIELADAGLVYGSAGGPPPPAAAYAGRFDGREPYWDYRDVNGSMGARYTAAEFTRAGLFLNYLPRFAKPQHGERQTWTYTWDHAADPDCNGVWEIGYHVHGSEDRPTYGPVVERHLEGDPEGYFEFANELEDRSDPYNLSMSLTPTGLEEDTVHQVLPGVINLKGVFNNFLPGSDPPVRATAVPWVYDAGATDIDGLRVGWEVKDSDDTPELADQRASLSWFVLPPEGCTATVDADDIQVDPVIEGWYEALTCYLRESNQGGCGLLAPPSAPPAPPSLPW